MLIHEFKEKPCQFYNFYKVHQEETYQKYQVEKEDIIKYGQDDIFVTDIPNTAIPSAKGYANSLNIKYMSVFEKRAGTGRTFILPNNTQGYTTNRIGLKIRENVDLSQCKSIILVDDSLVSIREVAEYCILSNLLTTLLSLYKNYAQTSSFNYT